MKYTIDEISTLVGMTLANTLMIIMAYISMNLLVFGLTLAYFYYTYITFKFIKRKAEDRSIVAWLISQIDMDPNLDDDVNNVP